MEGTKLLPSEYKDRFNTYGTNDKIFRGIDI